MRGFLYILTCLVGLICAAGTVQAAETAPAFRFEDYPEKEPYTDIISQICFAGVPLADLEKLLVEGGGAERHTLFATRSEDKPSGAIYMYKYQSHSIDRLYGVKVQTNDAQAVIDCIPYIAVSKYISPEVEEARRVAEEGPKRPVWDIPYIGPQPKKEADY